MKRKISIFCFSLIVFSLFIFSGKNYSDLAKNGLVNYQYGDPFEEAIQSMVYRHPNLEKDFGEFIKGDIYNNYKAYLLNKKFKCMKISPIHLFRYCYINKDFKTEEKVFQLYCQTKLLPSCKQKGLHILKMLDDYLYYGFYLVAKEYINKKNINRAIFFFEKYYWHSSMLLNNSIYSAKFENYQRKMDEVLFYIDLLSDTKSEYRVIDPVISLSKWELLNIYDSLLSPSNYKDVFTEKDENELIKIKQENDSTYRDYVLYILASKYFYNDDYNKALYLYNVLLEGYPYSKKADESLFMMGLAYLKLAKNELIQFPKYFVDSIRIFFYSIDSSKKPPQKLTQTQNKLRSNTESLLNKAYELFFTYLDKYSTYHLADNAFGYIGHIMFIKSNFLKAYKIYYDLLKGYPFSEFAVEFFRSKVACIEQLFNQNDSDLQILLKKINDVNQKEDFSYCWKYIEARKNSIESPILVGQNAIMCNLSKIVSDSQAEGKFFHFFDGKRDTFYAGEDGLMFNNIYLGLGGAVILNSEEELLLYRGSLGRLLTRDLNDDYLVFDELGVPYYQDIKFILEEEPIYIPRIIKWKRK